MTPPDNQPPTPFTTDIHFEVTSTGWEVWLSDRLVNEHGGLVDESADYLEDQIGVVNLGLVDHRILMADGPLTDEIKNGVTAWWAERVPDLKTG